jgi:uncharacterized protein YggE
MPEDKTKPKYMKFMMMGLVVVLGTAFIISNIMISQRPIYVQNNSGIDGKPVNNITVTSVGKVSVKPDVVTFTAGYSISKQNDMQTLQKDLTAKNNAIISALKAAGVEDKDITTSSFDIQPNYRYDMSTRYTDGYNGTVRISVKVRSIDKAGDIIDKSMGAGANIIESITFTVDDLTKVRADARVLAAKAAKDKAQTLADASGAGLGGLVSITESSSDYTPIYYNSVKEVSTASDSNSGTSTTISAGSLEISITVTATYGIK